MRRYSVPLSLAVTPCRGLRNIPERFRTLEVRARSDLAGVVNKPAHLCNFISIAISGAHVNDWGKEPGGNTRY